MDDLNRIHLKIKKKYENMISRTTYENMIRTKTDVEFLFNKLQNFNLVFFIYQFEGI